MFGCVNVLLASSMILTAVTGQSTYQDLRQLDAKSTPVTEADYESLNFDQNWRCTARSRVMQPSVNDLYILRFSRGDGQPRGRFLQSGLDSRYEIKDGELSRVTAGARLERNHFSADFSKFELESQPTRDITTIPHREVVRFTEGKTNLLIRVTFNEKVYGAEPPQAYIACTPW